MALELMSPAGSLESAMAAIAGGADAIYFGAGDFNARRSAKNISGEELPELLRYCRLRGVHTYVTVNTLLTDRELQKAAFLISTLNREGASAVIVQDLGVLRMVRALAPDLPVHASTQMTVHDLAGAIACKEMGFSRVVLSRELPLDEIRFITERCGIETEVFCHGALCMCYSGQCYLSAAIGGRSGNRGLCAQPCRMAYGFDGGKPAPWLSLKDLSLCTHLQELEQAGVACVKIEGRMKRPEYTALVTSIYKRAIQQGRAPTQEEMKQLEQVFSRSGFTDGYYTGKTGSQMFGVRREEDARAARGVYAQARQLYEGKENPRVPIHLSFTALEEREMKLTVTDGDGFSYEAQAPMAERAISRATTQEEVARNLSKTGGTVFYPEKMDIALDPMLRIPASTINAMRRQCLDGLTSLRRRPPRRREGEWQPGARRLEHQGEPGLIFQVQRFDQLSAPLLVLYPDYVYLPLEECVRHLPECIALQQEKGIQVAPVLPRIMFDSQWPPFLEMLRQCKKAGISQVVCSNVGHAALLKESGFALRGDFGLNIMNSQALKELKAQGLQSATLSFEMTFPQMRDVSKALPCEAIVYGRLPLMIFENCAIRRGAGKCACKEGQHFLSDKTGRQFPLFPEPGCRNTLYNSEPVVLSDKKKDYTRLGLRYVRLCFTTESAQECAAVARRYDQGLTMEGRFTRGLYYRGVE